MDKAFVAVNTRLGEGIAKRVKAATIKKALDTSNGMSSPVQVIPDDRGPHRYSDIRLPTIRAALRIGWKGVVLYIY
jgi:hypothetical protein